MCESNIPKIYYSLISLWLPFELSNPSYMYVIVQRHSLLKTNANILHKAQREETLLQSCRPLTESRSTSTAVDAFERTLIVLVICYASITL